MKITDKTLLLLGLMAILFAISGCEYDGPTAVYNQDRVQRLSPVITQVNPVEALAGDNYVTIIGENFAVDSGANKVYVNGVESEIVEYSATEIKIRRPSVTGDSTFIKLVTLDGLGLGEHVPYKISPVVSSYGGFIAGEGFSSLLVDDDDNVYAFHRTAKDIYKVEPDGNKNIIAVSSRIVKDVRMSADGQLVLFYGRKDIAIMDPVTGVESVLVTVDKNMTYGDYDSHGNLYGGGSKTDVFIIAPDLTNRTAGLYAPDKILGIRVFDDVLYLVLELRSPPDGVSKMGIWKHTILDAAGNLGEGELVLDWATTGVYADAQIKAFELSASGKLVVGTDHDDPILIVDTDQSQDILYKGIIPTRAEKIVWGNDNIMYMALQGTTYDLLAIDMGEKGAL